MRAARALLGLDQRDLARLSGLSLPTIQRMETSARSVRAVVDSLEKVLEAFATAGVEMIPDGAPSAGVGRGVRLIARAQRNQTVEGVGPEPARPPGDAPWPGSGRAASG